MSNISGEIDNNLCSSIGGADVEYIFGKTLCSGLKLSPFQAQS